MAYQSIGRGSTANDGTGDDLRAGAAKVNSNFSELYTLLGNGTNLTSDVVVLKDATQTVTNKSIDTQTNTITFDLSDSGKALLTGTIAQFNFGFVSHVSAPYNTIEEFFEWSKGDILTVNKFGIPEPLDNNKKSYLPDIVLVPLLAFDHKRNRLGYGKGFYDRYLHKLIKLNNKIETIGLAFSFQKYKKIPISRFDFKLNNIFTEKGFIK